MAVATRKKEEPSWIDDQSEESEKSAEREDRARIQQAKEDRARRQAQEEKDERLRQAWERRHEEEEEADEARHREAETRSERKAQTNAAASAVKSKGGGLKSMAAGMLAKMAANRAQKRSESARSTDQMPRRTSSGFRQGASDFGAGFKDAAKGTARGAADFGAGFAAPFRATHYLVSSSVGIIFVIIAIALHLLDSWSGFSFSINLRITIGLFMFFYAFLFLRGTPEINFEPKRMGVLLGFFIAYVIQGYLMSYASKMNEGVGLILTAAFIIAPVWVLYGLFVAPVEWATFAPAKLLKNVYIIIIFLVIVGQTSTYANTNLNIPTPKVDTAGAFASLKEGIRAGVSSIASIPSKLSEELTKQQFYATHGYYEGDVAEGDKVTYLEIADPFLPNTVKYEGTESEVRMRAYVNAFNVDTKMSLSLDCYSKKGNCNNDKDECPEAGGIIEPKQLLDKAIITEDVECKIPGSNFAQGSNIVGIRATANNFRTRAELRKYFIDKTSLDSALISNIRENKIKLSGPEDVTRIINQLYPSAKDALVSVSDDAPAKLIIATVQTPVIGVEKGQTIIVTLAFENNAEGYVSSINGLEMQYPEGMAPKKGFCDSFDDKGGRIAIKKGELNQPNLKDLANGQQRAFSSCTFEVTNPAALLDMPANINQRFFNAFISYDYVASKEYSIQYGESSSDNSFSDWFGYSPSDVYQSGGASTSATYSAYSKKLIWPASESATTISSCYGPRDYGDGWHDGMDVAIPQGSPIFAVADGKVYRINQPASRAYAFIIIKHSGTFYTQYGHLSKILVSEGDTVSQSQKIAESGGRPGTPGAGPSTGEHLHFAVSYADKWGDHVDREERNPLCYYNARASELTLKGSCSSAETEVSQQCPPLSVTSIA